MDDDFCSAKGKMFAVWNHKTHFIRGRMASFFTEPLLLLQNFQRSPGGIVLQFWPGTVCGKSSSGADSAEISEASDIFWPLSPP